MCALALRENIREERDPKRDDETTTRRELHCSEQSKLPGVEVDEAAAVLGKKTRSIQPTNPFVEKRKGTKTAGEEL